MAESSPTASREYPTEYPVLVLGGMGSSRKLAEPLLEEVAALDEVSDVRFINFGDSFHNPNKLNALAHGARILGHSASAASLRLARPTKMIGVDLLTPADTGAKDEIKDPSLLQIAQLPLGFMGLEAQEAALGMCHPKEMLGYMKLVGAKAVNILKDPSVIFPGTLREIRRTSGLKMLEDMNELEIPRGYFYAKWEVFPGFKPSPARLGIARQAGIRVEQIEERPSFHEIPVLGHSGKAHPKKDAPRTVVQQVFANAA